MKNPTSLLSSFVCIAYLLILNNVYASDLLLTSKNKNAIFIELFTSQGCSSCPPAEKYINTFSKKNNLWVKYIPIVFHVDYWDYIGWKDVFAESKFGTRQRQYANLKKVTTVYTPAFVVDGATWRRGFFNAVPQVKGLTKGELSAKITDKGVDAIYTSPLSSSDTLMLNIAILGMDMLVNVSAGENEGREARHSFVVLGHKTEASTNKHWQMSLPALKRHPKSTRYAVVVWVSAPQNPSPLQAVAGWLSHAEYLQ